MRTRMYGGVRGRKTKVGGKPTFVFLLLDLVKSKKHIIFQRIFVFVVELNSISYIYHEFMCQ